MFVGRFNYVISCITRVNVMSERSRVVYNQVLQAKCPRLLFLLLFSTVLTWPAAVM